MYAENGDVTPFFFNTITIARSRGTNAVKMSFNLRIHDTHIDETVKAEINMSSLPSAPEPSRTNYADLHTCSGPHRMSVRAETIYII